MRMARHHLVGNRAHHIVEGEKTCILRHLRVKHALEQKIAQLALQLAPRLPLDGVGDLIGFLDRIGCDGGEGLLDIPRAAGVGIAQTAHDRQQARHTALRVVNKRVAVSGHRNRSV
ncbi:hypothetical protein GALL_512250 [mine drainage metagenome]|uniref:Uncharacterized protein n=1 Tax=mine drainage metagenome TaxID=410659 RepID=A0A1J5P8X2_9ZZZZ